MALVTRDVADGGGGGREAPRTLITGVGSTTENFMFFVFVFEKSIYKLYSSFMFAK